MPNSLATYKHRITISEIITTVQLDSTDRLNNINKPHLGSQQSILWNQSCLLRKGEKWLHFSNLKEGIYIYIYICLIHFIVQQKLTYYKPAICCLAAKSCPTLCNPMDYSSQAPLFSTIPQNLLKFMSIELVMLFNHFILCCPFPLLPSVLPNIRVFSSESVQVAKVSELQFQQQSFQWMVKVDFL